MVGSGVVVVDVVVVVVVVVVVGVSTVSNSSMIDSTLAGLSMLPFLTVREGW